MKSVNKEVHDLINRHISIQKSLKRDIINIRSLAKYLIQEYNLKYSLDAVISAIRRFDLDDSIVSDNLKTKKMFQKMSVYTKDNVAKITLKDKAFRDVCEDFLNKKILKENLRVVKGKEVLSLIVNKKDLKKKMSLFKQADVISLNDNLSELRLHFPEDTTMIKGVISRITSELATRNINILETIISMPDILVYVEEKNLVEAHHALREIKK